MKKSYLLLLVAVVVMVVAVWHPFLPKGEIGSALPAIPDNFIEPTPETIGAAVLILALVVAGLIYLVRRKILLRSSGETR